MEVEQTPLPGAGIRYDFATTAGRRLAGRRWAHGVWHRGSLPGTSIAFDTRSVSHRYA